MINYTAVLLLLLTQSVYAAEAETKLTEEQVRFQAAVQELVAQRDAALARAANLAGELAAATLRLRELDAKKAPAAENTRR